jgi:tetratricopeptide (TPR) repeat protein
VRTFGALIAADSCVNVCPKTRKTNSAAGETTPARRYAGRVLIALALAWLASTNPAARGQEKDTGWQAKVRKDAEAHDWTGALRIVDGELARTPNDVEVLAWRARLLLWSGSVEDAEKLFRQLTIRERRDPDLFLGLASALAREGRWEESLQTLNRAAEIDPNRADLRAARGRTLRALNRADEAREEFSKALALDPGNEEATQGLLSVPQEFRNELRVGWDTDRFSYTDAYEGESVSLTTRWTQHWGSSVAGNFFQRINTGAGKFVASVTARSVHWGALTAGGATASDNGIIPRHEIFFSYDRGWRVSETSFLRGVEMEYGQHWYRYASARIFTLNGVATIYLPRELSWSINLTGARSDFSGLSPGWRPSGVTRLSFPLVKGKERFAGGSVFFAAGTEQFALVDQLGSFSSHTWGGSVKLRFTARQDVTAYGAFQRRTANRTQTSFGMSYGIHF